MIRTICNAVTAGSLAVAAVLALLRGDAVSALIALGVAHLTVRANDNEGKPALCPPTDPNP